MKQEFKIYIPSKGRATAQKTAALLAEAGLQFEVVVEPQEAEEYKAENPEYNYLVLPENDKGPVFVRNFILELCQQQGQKWVAVIDDDVNGFGDVKNKRCVKKDATILLKAYNTFDRFKRAVNSLNYDHLAWCASNPVSMNRFCEVVIFLYVPAISWRYKEGTKDDRDFVLNAIKSGAGTMRLNELWFSCPGVGANKGGLYDFYKAGKDVERVKQLCKDWPEVVEPVFKKGRLEMKIHWNKLTNE